MRVHAQTEEIRTGGVEVRSVEEGAFVVVAKDALRRVDTDAVPRHSLSQELARSLQPDVRDLQRGSGIGVGEGEIEQPVGVPPVGGDSVIHEVRTAAVPLCPDGGLIGDRPGS
jgi:hypothetical protein